LPESVEDQAEELQKVRAKWQQMLKSLITDRPQDFIRVVCHSVLAEPGAGDSWTSSASSGLRKRYLAPARLALQQLEGTNLPAPQPEYICARTWIEEEARGGVYLDHVFYDHYQDARTYEDLWRVLFDPILDSLADAETRVALRVYHGVPVYQWEGNKFELVDDSSEELAYLRQRGKRYEVVHASSMPLWADKFYLRTDHLQTYEAFYAADYEQSEAEINQLRAGYRYALGLIPDGPPLANRRTHSRLMTLTEKVYERYYGANFSSTDTDTWPRQKDIVAWLREAHGLSEREAQAVDIVCRPDALRGK
jgi:hypothetical protein